MSKLKSTYRIHCIVSTARNMVTARSSARVQQSVLAVVKAIQIQCTNPPKCANCSGNHPAYSKDCPRWTIEKQVQQVKATNNISFVEARRKVESEAASHRPTIAAIISRPPGNQDARPVSSCTPLKPVSYTHLTLPTTPYV